MAHLLDHFLLSGNTYNLCGKRYSPMSDHRKKDQPKPFKGEFSFVNKDAGNIDSKDHNAAVSWHVMNRYERWKKQEQARKLRASANVPVQPLSPPQPGRSTSSLSSSTRNLQLGEQQQTQTSPRLDRVQSSQFLVSASSSASVSPHSGLYTFEDDAILGPQGLSEATSSTGFNPPVMQMTPLVNTLIAFAYETLIPERWPNEAGRIQGTYEIARSWDDTAAIAQDTCFANSYLALLAAAMSTTLTDDNLAYQARIFQSQAMTELRRRLAQKQTVQHLFILKAILKLFSCETMVDNTSVARVHMKMLRNLVLAEGGIILLDSWLREEILSCDAYFALKYGTRPVFQAQEWTPGALSQPWKARLVSAGIFGEHATGVDSLIDNSALKAIINDLRELLKAEEYISKHELAADDQLLRWKQLRKFDCISRLADHYVNLTIYAHVFTRPLTQGYTCVAAALLVNMVLGCPEPVRLGLKLISDLRTKMLEAEAEPGFHQTQRLRLWAAWVGSLAEQVHPVAEGTTWFQERYQQLVETMGLQGWDNVKKVLRGILVSDSLQNEVESGRIYRTECVRGGLYTVCGMSWREPFVSDIRSSTPEDLSQDRGKQKALSSMTEQG